MPVCFLKAYNKNNNFEKTPTVVVIINKTTIL